MRQDRRECGARHRSGYWLAFIIISEREPESWILSAHRNLPKSLVDNLYQPWDDGISSLVGLSGETPSIHGESMKRFQTLHVGRSALIVLLKFKTDVICLLTTVRKEDKPFSQVNQYLLEEVEDYASISLANASLFPVLEECTRSLQKAAETAQVSEQLKDVGLQKLRASLRTPLITALKNLEQLRSSLEKPSGNSSFIQNEVLKAVQ